LKNIKSQIETILFIAAKPISLKKIAESLDISESDVSALIDDLQKEYNVEKKGFRIVRAEKQIELVSAPENESIVKKFFQKETEADLSKASLETLSVVAYKGPVSRSQIEEERGVNSIITLRNLMIRGLIERSGKNKEGEYLYKITSDLLKRFGIERQANLPEYKLWS